MILTIKTQEYKVIKHKILYKKAGIRCLSVKQMVLHQHTCRKILFTYNISANIQFTKRIMIDLHKRLIVKFPILFNVIFFQLIEYFLRYEEIPS